MHRNFFKMGLWERLEKTSNFYFEYLDLISQAVRKRFRTGEQQNSSTGEPAGDITYPDKIYPLCGRFPG